MVFFTASVTKCRCPVHAALSDHPADGLHLWAAAGARLHCVARRGEFVQKRPGTCNLRAQCVHPGTKPRIGGVDQNRFAVRKCIDQLHDAVVRAIAPSMPGMNHGKALARRRHAGRPGSIEHDCPCGFAVARQWSDLGDKPLRGLGTVAPPAIRTRPHHVVAVHEHRGLLGLGHAALPLPSFTVHDFDQRWRRDAMPALEIADCINETRPWSGKPVQPDSLTEYNGEVVGFCNSGYRDTLETGLRHFEKARASRRAHE